MSHCSPVVQIFAIILFIQKKYVCVCVTVCVFVSVCVSVLFDTDTRMPPSHLHLPPSPSPHPLRCICLGGNNNNNNDNIDNISSPIRQGDSRTRHRNTHNGQELMDDGLEFWFEDRTPPFEREPLLRNLRGRRPANVSCVEGCSVCVCVGVCECVCACVCVWVCV